MSAQMEALLGAALGPGPAPPPPAAVAAVPVAAVAPPAVPVMAVAVPMPAGAVPAVEVIGCKLDVWKGRAVRTRGGLMKQHLKLNRIGTVVSIKASDAAKRNKNLGNFQFPVKN